MVCVCVIERELEITAAIFKTQNQYGDLKHQYTMYIQKTKGEGFVFWYFGDVPVHENLRVGCAYITCAHVHMCVDVCVLCTVYCVLLLLVVSLLSSCPRIGTVHHDHDHDPHTLLVLVHVHVRMKLLFTPLSRSTYVYVLNGGHCTNLGKLI